MENNEGTILFKFFIIITLIFGIITFVVFGIVFAEVIAIKNNHIIKNKIVYSVTIDSVKTDSLNEWRD